jgi:hypothetical protein
MRLTSKDENPGARDYVAVSYCWNQPPDGRPTAKFEIETESDDRANKAPASILMRAVQYALKVHVSFIWIDQECIDQDEVEDKAIGIQSMDLVYSQSRFPVGILGKEISQESVVNTLNRFRDWQSAGHRELVNLCRKHLSDSDVTAAGEFLDSLRDDNWFNRAWTHQESACARESMKLLLQRKSITGSESGSWKDFVVPFKHIDRWAQSLRTAVRNEPEELMASLSLSSESIPNRPLRSLGQARELLTASDVVPQLERKENSVVTDRLAIIANSCSYQLRLDIPAALKQDFHLSSCALTMAILNGDVNPWPENKGEEYRQAAWFSTNTNRPKVKKPTLEMILPEFLVMWNRLYGCRGDVYADSPRLPAVRLTATGFYTRGWLWSVDRFSRIDVGPAITTRILSLLNQKSDSPALRNLLNELCVRIYNSLGFTGLPGVAASFWNTLHDFPPFPNPKLKFNPMIPCKSNPGDVLPTDVFGNCYDYTPLADRSQKAIGFALVDRWQEAPWFIRFIKYVLKRKFMPLARLFGPNRTSDPRFYTAVFPVKEYEVGTFIFTSTDQNLVKIDGPMGLSNFFCIEVAVGDYRKPDLSYKGSWNRGFWMTHMTEMREYFFPWNVPLCGEPRSTCRPAAISFDEVFYSAPGQSHRFAPGA